MNNVEQSPKVGILNLMPAAAMEKSYDQWQLALSEFVELVPIRFDEDPRLTHCRSGQIVREYSAVSEVADSLEGIIVTGANLERRNDASPLPFEEISYADQLEEVINWAEQDLRVNVYSCLASHFALSILHDITRRITEAKTFGVFCHDVISNDKLTSGLQIPVRAPHSRWGSVCSGQLSDAGIDVLIEGFETDWLLAKSNRPTGVTVYIQGHPEYQRYDLKEEFDRDKQDILDVPHKYFKGDDPSAEIRYTWQEDSAQIFRNIGRLFLDKKYLQT